MKCIHYALIRQLTHGRALVREEAAWAFDLSVEKL
jgi:hypothetical protein